MEQLKRAITAGNLSFGYGKSLILDRINVEIEDGKLTIILGQNGSGKSTFLRVLAGLLIAQNGKLTIAGKDVSSLSFKEKSKLIGFLNQQHKAIFPFSVADVVLTGRAGFINYIPKETDLLATNQAMDKVGIWHLRNRNYTELSGGEQQMVMIARLLAQNSKILLLDEPTNHLDFDNQSHILTLLKQLIGEGTTIIAVMHDPNLAFMFGDDFLFLKNKKVIRPEETTKAWDNRFLKTIYNGKLETIPYNNRALIVPSIN